MLTCKHCGKSGFGNLCGLRSHEKYCGDVEKKYECECGKRFVNGGHFKTHQNWCDQSDREAPETKKYKKVECPECSQKVAKPQLRNHIGSKNCKSGGTVKIKCQPWKIGENKYKCPECDKVYGKRGIATHYWLNHTDEGKLHTEKLSKNGNNFVVDDFEKPCSHCGKIYDDPRSLGGHITTCKSNPDYGSWLDKITEINKQGREYTEAQKKRHSNIMKRVVAENPGSYAARNINQRFKKPKIKTPSGEKVKLDSYWEFIVAEWLNENGIGWSYDTGFFKYVWKESERNYFPDFYLPEQDVYIEVKGYEKERDRCKWRDFPETLIIIKKDEIEEIKEGTYTLNMGR